MPPPPRSTLFPYTTLFRSQHVDLMSTGVDAWWPDEGDWFNLFERMKRHQDRKSTRLNSSHSQISYAVFCLKKKKNLLNMLAGYRSGVAAAGADGEGAAAVP